MRKLLLLLTIGMLYTACQKDYYLEDLQNAEAQIESLNMRISGLRTDVQNITSDWHNAVHDFNVVTHELEITNAQLEQLLMENESLTSNNLDLMETVVSLEEEVAELLLEVQWRTEALDRAAVTRDEQHNEAQETIGRLTDRIFLLEAEIAALRPQLPQSSTPVNSQPTVDEVNAQLIADAAAFNAIHNPPLSEQINQPQPETQAPTTICRIKIFNISDPRSTRNDGCAIPSVSGVAYHDGAGDEPVTGDRIYRNNDCESPITFDGGDQWYKITYGFGSSTQIWVIQVSSSGEVLNESRCS